MRLGPMARAALCNTQGQPFRDMTAMNTSALSPDARMEDAKTERSIAYKAGHFKQWPVLKIIKPMPGTKPGQEYVFTRLGTLALKRKENIIVTGALRSREKPSSTGIWTQAVFNGYKKCYSANRRLFKNSNSVNVSGLI